MLIESAGVYSLWMVIVLVFAVIEHPLYPTFYDIATELYGLSTMLISVRVGLGWAIGNGGQVVKRLPTTARSDYPSSNQNSNWKPASSLGGQGKVVVGEEDEDDKKPNGEGKSLVKRLLSYNEPPNHV